MVSLMARKTASIKSLRAEADAVAAMEKEDAKKAPKKKKAPAKRKTRKKAVKEIRLKAYWGVFNQSLKRIALYEYADKKKADTRAKELSATGKNPHFVQPVKEAFEEELPPAEEGAEVAAPKKKAPKKKAPKKKAAPKKA